MVLFQVGGGGGSGIYITSDPQPLIAAGGGGGASYNGHNSNPIGGDAVIGAVGQSSSGQGGANGVGGYGGFYPNDCGWSSGGGGWQGSGYEGSGSNTTGTLGGSSAGKSVTAGGNGGTGGGCGGSSVTNGGFGFGGGGSGTHGGGGGGGYSGGGGGQYRYSDYRSVGGGGGSYNAGAYPVNTAGANAGHGKVTITLLSAPATIELDRGLVAHYPMDNNSKDVIGENDLTEYGDATLTSDRFGHQDGAYYFDGTDDYLKSSNNVGISGNDNRTLVYWQKSALTDYSSVANAHVVNWGEAYNNKSFGTYIQSSSDNVSTYLHGTGLVSSEKVTDRWEHWTITYDGFKVNMYKNGVQVSDKTVTSLQTGLSGLWIGARMGGGDFFNGAIDDIRIYDRPLNSAEIQALYHVYDPLPPVIGSVLINNGADNTSIDSL